MGEVAETNEGRKSLAPAEEPARIFGSSGQAKRGWAWAVGLLGATCVSTWFVGALHWEPTKYLGDWPTIAGMFRTNWLSGVFYMGAILGILGGHELGHFLTARRYRITATYPYFLPVPLVPFGTLGAVIGLADTQANRRQLFDLAVAGPIIGLILALGVAWIGLAQWSPPPAQAMDGVALELPLVLRVLVHWHHPQWQQGAVPLGRMNPWLMAAWVGIWITGLNLLPIGQLDGGHIAYALLGRRAHWVARSLLVCAIGYILIAERYEWVLMVVLLCLLGPDHPPVSQEEVPLTRSRGLLGWMVLALPVLCFTPHPIRFR